MNAAWSKGTSAIGWSQREVCCSKRPRRPNQGGVAVLLPVLTTGGGGPKAAVFQWAAVLALPGLATLRALASDTEFALSEHEHCPRLHGTAALKCTGARCRRHGSRPRR